MCIHSIGPQLLHNGFCFDGMSNCHCFHINTTTSQDRQSICLPRQSGDRPRRRRGRVKFVNPLQVRERYLPTAFDQLGKEKGAEMQQVRWTEKGRERDEQVRNFEKGSRHWTRAKIARKRCRDKNAKDSAFARAPLSKKGEGVAIGLHCP